MAPYSWTPDVVIGIDFGMTCTGMLPLQFKLDVGMLRLAIPLYTYESPLSFSLLMLLYCAFIYQNSLYCNEMRSILRFL